LRRRDLERSEVSASEQRNSSNISVNEFPEIYNPELNSTSEQAQAWEDPSEVSSG
jgi:hypothetical protein|tara:strand:- start:279 stop:443 length:165 start_codon:yes stop_codon:yes gene_type:complete